MSQAPDDLDRALAEANPEPPETLVAAGRDPGAIETRARIIAGAPPCGRQAGPRRRLSRAIAGLAGVTAVAVVLGALIVAAPDHGPGRAGTPAPGTARPTSPPSDHADLRVALLDGPPAPATEIPGALLEALDQSRAGSPRSCSTDRTELRRGVERNGRTVWIGTGPGGSVSLHEVGPGAVASTCRTRESLAREGIVWISGRDRDAQPWVTAGLVPDGYTTVTVGAGTSPATIERNTFLLETAEPPGALVLDGPAGRRTVSLGARMPPTLPDMARLSILDAPAVPAAEVPERVAAAIELGGRSRANPRSARVDDLRRGAQGFGTAVWVAPLPGERVGLYAFSRGWANACVDCAEPARVGIAWLGGRDPSGRRWVTVGLVPDGYDTVKSSDASARVVGNSFVLATADPVASVVLTGPAGQRAVDLPGAEDRDQGVPTRTAPPGTARRVPRP